MKKRTLILLLALCLLTLSGCVSAANPTTVPDVPTLAPASSAYEAPVNDDGLAYTTTAVLYLPSRDRQSLLAQYATVELRHSVSSAETIVRALLAYPSNDRVTSLSGAVTLGLYGPNPVEVAGNVCTVNLSSSVLQLEYNDRYTVFLALASTLGELDNIRFVNVLVADQAIGLDISGNLAAGSLIAHPGEELPVLWEQMDARRTPLGADPAVQPLTATATLYFPLADGTGILPETRNLTFTGQTAQALTTGLLNALSDGAQYLDGTAAMPDMSTILTSAPELSELAGGGRMITLHLAGDYTDRLDLLGIDRTDFIGALVYTIQTFVPSVGAVRIYAGSSLMTSLDGMTFADGIQHRRQFAGLLMDQVTIYLACENRLVPVIRTLPAAMSDDPRSLLALIMAGATDADRANGISSVLPASMDGSDVLGVSIIGDTMLLNLSPRFERLISQNDQSSEQLLCYSIVSTLCQAKHLRRMQFFFGGEMRESLGGQLYWGGEFILNTGLIDQTMG